jgi:hypothetical protein
MGRIIVQRWIALPVATDCQLDVSSQLRTYKNCDRMTAGVRIAAVRDEVSYFPNGLTAVFWQRDQPWTAWQSLKNIRIWRFGLTSLPTLMPRRTDYVPSLGSVTHSHDLSENT